MLKVEKSQMMEDLTHASVTEDPDWIKKQVTIHNNAYTATSGTHAIVLCTEWDEFQVSDITIY